MYLIKEDFHLATLEPYSRQPVEALNSGWNILQYAGVYNKQNTNVVRGRNGMTLVADVILTLILWRADGLNYIQWTYNNNYNWRYTNLNFLELINYYLTLTLVYLHRLAVDAGRIPDHGDQGVQHAEAKQAWLQKPTSGPQKPKPNVESEVKVNVISVRTQKLINLDERNQPNQSNWKSISR